MSDAVRAEPGRAAPSKVRTFPRLCRLQSGESPTHRSGYSRTNLQFSFCNLQFAISPHYLQMASPCECTAFSHAFSDHQEAEPNIPFCRLRAEGALREPIRCPHCA